MWNCLADEHISPNLATALANVGIEVATVAGRHLFGAADEELAALALAEQRLIITNDTDFLRLSDLANQQGKAMAPVLFWPRSSRSMIRHLVSQISQLAAADDYAAICNRIFYL